MSAQAKPSSSGLRRVSTVLVGRVPEGPLAAFGGSGMSNSSSICLACATCRAHQLA